MNEDIETKLEELRLEFKVSIKELEIRQEFDNRAIKREYEEFEANTSREHEMLKSTHETDLSVVRESMRQKIEMLEIEVRNLKEKHDRIK